MLRDATGMVVDTAWYVTDYGQNISLIPAENDADPWVPSTWMTPGQPDPVETPSTGLVIFTEVFPDAVGSDSQQWPLGEWLEIYNNGTSALTILPITVSSIPKTIPLLLLRSPVTSPK